MKLLGQYWGCFQDKPRIYHHTISSTLLYGLREALAQVVEEGIAECVARHQHVAALLYHGLDQLGFDFFVADATERLPTVTTIRVREGMDWKRLTQFCLNM